jgi:hypothetical protein
MDRSDCRRDCICVEDGDGAVWSKTIAKERVVGYARAEVASVSRSERDESRIWSDVLEISFGHDGPCEAYGAISIEPSKMAKLAPAMVIVNGLRSIESCFDIRDLTRAEGINKEPTAKSSASTNKTQAHTHNQQVSNDWTGQPQRRGL